jgi:hypothetical protein
MKHRQTGNDAIARKNHEAVRTRERRTAYIQPDLRDPAAILAHPVVGEVLDRGQPVGLVLAAILHFIVDSDQPRQIIATRLDALPPGSAPAPAASRGELLRRRGPQA